LPAESDITGERDAGVDEAPTSPAPGAETTDRLAGTTDGLSSCPMTVILSSVPPILWSPSASSRCLAVGGTSTVAVSAPADV